MHSWSHIGQLLALVLVAALPVDALARPGAVPSPTTQALRLGRFLAHVARHVESAR